MATFSKNPRRFTGTEKLIVDALVLKKKSLKLSPELRLPFPDAASAESAKARVWAYVRAMEAMVSMKQMRATGHPGGDMEVENLRKEYLSRANDARHFTTRKVPSGKTEGGTDLLFYLSMDRPAEKEVVDYLADQIATMSQEQGNE